MPEKNDRWYKRYQLWRETPIGQEAYKKSLVMARDLVKGGWDHYSMQTIACVVRYKLHLKCGPDQDRRSNRTINNNMVSFMARELMTETDIPSDFFETRSHGSATRMDQAEMFRITDIT